jgi:Ca2+-transporting ATPase
MTVLLIAVFLLVLPMGLETARSTLMTGIVLFEFVRIGAIRYEEKMKWGSNRWLVWGLLVSILLQIIILYTPLNQYFKLVPLGRFEWFVLLSGAILGYYLAIWITRLVMSYTPRMVNSQTNSAVN